MANMDLLVKAVDTAIWEMGEAFNGLPDEDTWKCAHPRLLSVGELAAHVAHWEAQSFLGGDSVESPLTTAVARYYTSNVEEPFKQPLGAEGVYKEVQRVHALCKESFVTNPHDSEEPNPHREGWTWGAALEYQGFHVAYHTGQMYSVRHLLGHQTKDN